MKSDNSNGEKDMIAVFPGANGGQVAISRRFFIAADGPYGNGKTYVTLSTGHQYEVKSTPKEIAEALNI